MSPECVYTYTFIIDISIYFDIIFIFGVIHSRYRVGTYPFILELALLLALDPGLDWLVLAWEAGLEDVGLCLEEGGLFILDFSLFIWFDWVTSTSLEGFNVFFDDFILSENSGSVFSSCLCFWLADLGTGGFVSENVVGFSFQSLDLSIAL